MIKQSAFNYSYAEKKKKFNYLGRTVRIAAWLTWVVLKIRKTTVYDAIWIERGSCEKKKTTGMERGGKVRKTNSFFLDERKAKSC